MWARNMFGRVNKMPRGVRQNFIKRTRLWIGKINKIVKTLRSLNRTLRVREGALVNITVKSIFPLKFVKMTTLIMKSLKWMKSIGFFRCHLLNNMLFQPIHSQHNPNNRWFLNLLDLCKGEMRGHILIIYPSSCARKMSTWLSNINLTMCFSQVLPLRTHQLHYLLVDLSHWISLWNPLITPQGCSP